MMAAVVLLLLAFHQWGAEPLKQMLAECTGQVEADGRRKRMVMQIGVIVSDPESPASAPRRTAVRASCRRWCSPSTSPAACC